MSKDQGVRGGGESGGGREGGGRGRGREGGEAYSYSGGGYFLEGARAPAVQLEAHQMPLKNK